MICPVHVLFITYLIMYFTTCW